MQKPCVALWCLREETLFYLKPVLECHKPAVTELHGVSPVLVASYLPILELLLLVLEHQYSTVIPVVGELGKKAASSL